MFKRIINWLDRLTQEFPAPKAQQPSIKLIQPTLTPTEQEIIKQAEQALQQSEPQCQAVIQSIQASPVICPDPEPITFLEIPELLEVSPAPLPVEATNIEAIATVTEISEVPELPQPTAKASSKKASSRGQLVEQHLNQAWADGFRTYEQLMNYVELATGKACSKKVISAWKKARKLDEATAA